MPERVVKYGTADQLPRVSQKLRLACNRCGKKARYDIGTLFCKTEEKTDEKRYAFTNYFRCSGCDCAGPWEVADALGLLAFATRAMVDKDYHGFQLGGTTLFDGTMLQTPAMGEEYLLGLLRKEPGSAFLCTRLGNLLRGAGQSAQSVSWYEKALALDAGDIEARYHLLTFAANADDVAGALVHGPQLIAQMLRGRVTNIEELTEGIAYAVVSMILNAPAAFHEHFLGPPLDRPWREEELFIRALLSQNGDEEQIEAEAAERLLAGEVAPLAPEAPDSTEIHVLPETDLFASLRALVEKEGLNPDRLTVPLETNGQGDIRIENRHLVAVSDGKKVAHWPVASLRELFRGTRKPPPDIDRFPPEYMPHFYFIEVHFLTLCRIQGDRTDQQMEEIYSTLRKRPDGKSLGNSHDFLWQVAALLLGTHAMSGAEFEALFASLTASTRKWGLKPVSRNYAHYLRTAIDGLPSLSAASREDWIAR